MSNYPPNVTIPGSVYQVVQLLGQGGMGTVYEVEDTTVGKRYVLKTLHSELRDRKELAERINKEARVLARLSHPNIVEVVTAGMTEDSLRLPYFVMQKLDGHTLRSVLAAKGRLPTQTAYSIAIDLLDALDHAHSLGVIHRDVKPENIFLHRGPTDSHQTKLLDFGVMHLLSGELPAAAGRFVGTLRYAPPEQLSGGAITQRTDLYAAGLVLYEMLAGSGPFDDHTTDREIANAHLERVPPPLSSCIEISPELDALVMSALSKDPEERPRDAFSFAAKLRELSRAAIDTRSAVEALLKEIGVPASATNLDGMTPSEYAAPARAQRTARKAKPALRVNPNATTDPIRRTATTMGALSSRPPSLPTPRRSGALVLAFLGFAVLAGWLVLGARGTKAGAAGAMTSPPATPLDETTITTTSARSVIAIPASAASPAVPATTSTPSASGSALPHASHPAPSAHHAEKPRLPGPGF